MLIDSQNTLQPEGELEDDELARYLAKGLYLCSSYLFDTNHKYMA